MVCIEFHLARATCEGWNVGRRKRGMGHPKAALSEGRERGKRNLQPEKS